MRHDRHDRWVITAVLVGAALRFVNLGAAPLWFDETYTFHHLIDPWAGFLTGVVHDNQAPLYYVTAKAWTELFGPSPTAMRMPGLLASVACISLIALLAELAASPPAERAAATGARATRAAAWLAAVSPFLVQHAQDARPYALLATFATADLVVLLRFVRGETSRLGLHWVVLAIAVVATHYYGIFFLAGEGLALLILRPRPLRSWLPEGIVAGALCAGIVLAAARAVNGAFAGQYVFGITALPGVVWSMLTGYTLLPTSERLHALGPRAILPYLPIALAALPAFALVAAAGVRALDRAARIALLTTFGVALAAPFAYRLALGAGVHPRYFAAAIAPIFVVTAVGMAQARIASPRGVATVLLATIMLYATWLHLRDTGHGREDVAAAGRWLDGHVAADEEILVTSNEMEILARFHWPNRRFRLYPSERGAIPSDEMPTVVASMPFDEEHQRAIFVVGRAWLTDPDGKLQTALAEHYPTCPGADVPGIRIHCYEPRTEATVATAAR